MASPPTNARPVEGQARLALRIQGRVQGVGFRYATVDTARRLGLTGWVRNSADGDVEVMAEGRKGALQRLATWAHVGPPGALVTSVEEQWLPYRGEFEIFRTIH